jgi:hypothetical protein
MKGERNPERTQKSYERLIKAGFIAKAPPTVAAARPQPVKCAPSAPSNAPAASRAPAARAPVPSFTMPANAAPKPFVVPQGVTNAPACYVGGVPGASCR